MVSGSIAMARLGKQIFFRIFFNAGRYKGSFRNGGPNGAKCKIFYSNEKLQYFGEMCEGKRENYGKCFYDNGVLCIDGNFKEDKLEGENITIYWSNGKLQYYGHMRGGKCEGYGKAFYLGGKLRYAGFWKNDWPDGENVQIFKENGDIGFEGTLVEGKTPDQKRWTEFK
jgi:antitoxin component YwqK of YwqJK toxin-antitoxin module